MKCVTISKILREKFQSLGFIISSHPAPFIIVPFLFTLVSLTGALRFSYQQDADYLYNPTNSKAFYDRKLISEVFLLNKSNDFEPGRLTSLGKFAWLLIYPKDGGTILRESFFQTLEMIDKVVKNVSIDWKGERLFLKDLCAKNNGQCYENEIFSLKRRIKDIEKKRAFVKYPILLNEDTYSFKFYASNMGGVEVDDLGFVTYSKLARLMYFLNDENEENVNLAYNWGTEFLESIKKIEFPDVKVYYFLSSSLEREIHRMVIEVIPFYVLLFFVMLGFCIISTLTKDWMRSKPWLGVASVISVLMAILSSAGITLCIGYPFIDLVIAIPFLLLGIGLDDTFVMIAAWKKTNPKTDVDKRVVQTLVDSAVSITITSFTNFISFMFGFMTPFPAVKIFCAFAASGILFTFVFQITFFTAALVIFGRIEEKRLHSLFFVPIRPTGKKCFEVEKPSMQLFTVSNSTVCSRSWRRPAQNAKTPYCCMTMHVHIWLGRPVKSYWT